MAVTSDHIFYPDGGDAPAYDLRKITQWTHVTGDSSKIMAHFEGAGDTPAAVPFDKAAFETAKQTSLDAGG